METAIRHKHPGCKPIDLSADGDRCYGCGGHREQVKYTGHASGNNSALQGHSVGEGYPWIIVGTSLGPDAQTYWYGLNAQSGDRTGTFKNYQSAKDACVSVDRYRASLALLLAKNPVHDEPDAEAFEIDEAPAAVLRDVTKHPRWNIAPEEVKAEARDQLAKRGDESGVTIESIWFRDILNDKDQAKRISWARYWLLGRWESAGKATIQHWIDVAAMLSRHGNGLQKGAFTKHVVASFGDQNKWPTSSIIKALRGEKNIHT